MAVEKIKIQKDSILSTQSLIRCPHWFRKSMQKIGIRPKERPFWERLKQLARMKVGLFLMSAHSGKSPPVHFVLGPKVFQRICSYNV